jgi:phosphatidylinositol phospholipase C delta
MQTYKVIEEEKASDSSVDDEEDNPSSKLAKADDKLAMAANSKETS